MSVAFVIIGLITNWILLQKNALKIQMKIA